ncbi:UNVERIFIED_CONTAM: hypothetical protein HDU68_009973, partial [Siphonaria sp. JEL0065]
MATPPSLSPRKGYTIYYSDPECSKLATKIVYSNAAVCSPSDPLSNCLPSPLYRGWFIKTGCFRASDTYASLGNTHLGLALQVHYQPDSAAFANKNCFTKGIQLPNFENNDVQYRVDECIRTFNQLSTSSYERASFTKLTNYLQIQRFGPDCNSPSANGEEDLLQTGCYNYELINDYGWIRD